MLIDIDSTSAFQMNNSFLCLFLVALYLQCPWGQMWCVMCLYVWSRSFVIGLDATISIVGDVILYVLNGLQES